MSEENLRVIVDAAGRTIVGEFSSENTKKFELKNPATLFIQPNQQSGQLAVQLIPFFFREFIAEGQRATKKEQLSLFNRTNNPVNWQYS